MNENQEPVPSAPPDTEVPSDVTPDQAPSTALSKDQSPIMWSGEGLKPDFEELPPASSVEAPSGNNIAKVPSTVTINGQQMTPVGPIPANPFKDKPPEGMTPVGPIPLNSLDPVDLVKTHPEAALKAYHEKNPEGVTVGDVMMFTPKVAAGYYQGLVGLLPEFWHGLTALTNIPQESFMPGLDPNKFDPETWKKIERGKAEVQGAWLNMRESLNSQYAGLKMNTSKLVSSINWLTGGRLGHKMSSEDVLSYLRTQAHHRDISEKVDQGDVKGAYEQLASEGGGWFSSPSTLNPLRFLQERPEGPAVTQQELFENPVKAFLSEKPEQVQERAAGVAAQPELEQLGYSGERAQGLAGLGELGVYAAASAVAPEIPFMRPLTSAIARTGLRAAGRTAKVAGSIFDNPFVNRQAHMSPFYAAGSAIAGHPHGFYALGMLAAKPLGQGLKFAGELAQEAGMPAGQSEILSGLRAEAGMPASFGRRTAIRGLQAMADGTVNIAPFALPSQTPQELGQTLGVGGGFGLFGVTAMAGRNAVLNTTLKLRDGTPLNLSTEHFEYNHPDDVGHAEGIAPLSDDLKAKINMNRHGYQGMGKIFVFTPERWDADPRLTNGQLGQYMPNGDFYVRGEKGARLALAHEPMHGIIQTMPEAAKKEAYEALMKHNDPSEFGSVYFSARYNKPVRLDFSKLPDKVAEPIDEAKLQQIVEDIKQKNPPTWEEMGANGWDVEQALRTKAREQYGSDPLNGQITKNTVLEEMLVDAMRQKSFPEITTNPAVIQWMQQGAGRMMDKLGIPMTPREITGIFGANPSYTAVSMIENILRDRGKEAVKAGPQYGQPMSDPSAHYEQLKDALRANGYNAGKAGDMAQQAVDAAKARGVSVGFEDILKFALTQKWPSTAPRQRPRAAAAEFPDDVVAQEKAINQRVRDYVDQGLPEEWAVQQVANEEQAGKPPPQPIIQPMLPQPNVSPPSGDFFMPEIAPQTEEFKRWSGDAPVVLNAGVREPTRDQLGLRMENAVGGGYNITDGQGNKIEGPIAHIQLASDTMFHIQQRLMQERLSQENAGKFQTGQPIVVGAYHGTPSGQFHVFDENKLGTYTGAPSASEGFFFSGLPDTARAYKARSKVPVEGYKGLSSGEQYALVSKIMDAADHYNYTENPMWRMEYHWAKEGKQNVQKWAVMNDLGERITSNLTQDAAEAMINDHNSALPPRLNVDQFIEKFPHKVKTLAEDLTGKEFDMTPAEGGHMHEVYVKFQNPFVYDFKGNPYREESYYNLLKQAKAQGHDGAIFTNTYDGGGKPDNIFVSFKNRNIKSTENVGTFDPYTADIRYMPQPDNPDAIKGAAIKLPDGRILTGAWHGVIDKQVPPEFKGKGIDGFVTGNDRFLTRDEAWVVGKRFGQIPKYARPLNKDQLKSGEQTRPQLISEDIRPPAYMPDVGDFQKLAKDAGYEFQGDLDGVLFWKHPDTGKEITAEPWRGRENAIADFKDKLSGKYVPGQDVYKTSKAQAYGPQGERSRLKREGEEGGRFMPEVNIGMHVGGEEKLTSKDIADALEAVPGVKILKLSEQRKEGLEPTVVATLSRALTPKEGDAVSRALDQESIAQHQVGGQGDLFGPQAEKWGPFNPDYFVGHDGRQLTDTLKDYYAAHPKRTGASGIWDRMTVDPNFMEGEFEHAVEATGANPKERFYRQTPAAQKAIQDYFMGRGEAQFMPNPHPEAIESAAIKTDDGKIFKGITHSDAEDKLPRSYAGGWTSGFVTKKGDFLGNQEAFEHAVKIGQQPRPLPSERPYDLESVAFSDDRRFMPNPHPDAIKQPAFKLEDGTVISEPVGYHSMIKLPKGAINTALAGFTTNKGEFLNRKQALARALEHKQISAAAADPRNWTETAIDQQLHAPDVKEGSTSVPWQYMPDVPNDARLKDALSEDKASKVGAHRDLPKGTPVSLRIDIPAYNKTGDYAVTVHDRNIGKVHGYDGIATVDNPTFYVQEKGAQKVKEGMAKYPMAAVNGEFNPSRAIPKDINDYAKVGFNPVKHSYFYDKSTGDPVISGDKAISAGNTVYVKNPVYGNPVGFLYMPDNPMAIDRAAIRRKSDGEIITGGQNDTHFMIPASSGKADDYLGMNGHKLYEEGFVSQAGYWYDREQAHNQMKAMGQLPPNYQGEYGGEANVTDLRKAKAAQMMPEPKEGYIGHIEDDGNIEGEKFFKGQGGDHEERGYNGLQWRYNNDTQKAYWWSTPGPEEKAALADWLDKRGKKLEGNVVISEAGQFGSSTRNKAIDEAHLFMPNTPAEAHAQTAAEAAKYPEAKPLRWKLDEAGQPAMIYDKKTKKTTAKPIEEGYNLAKQYLAEQAAEGKSKLEAHAAKIKVAKDKLKEFYDVAKDNPEAMQANGWYRELKEKLLDKLGGNDEDLILFTRLLATTSPNTNPGVNFGFALDAWNRFQKGEYKNVIDKYNQALTDFYAGKLKHTNGKPVEGLKQFAGYLYGNDIIPYATGYHEKGPQKGDPKKLGMHSLRVLDTISDHYDRINGLKINQFAHNLAQTDLKSTIDLWAARTLHRLLNDGNTNPWRILPMNEKGISEADFHFAQEAFGKAAEELKVSPDDLQAILWFAEKIHYDKQGWSTYLDKGDFRPLVERMVPDKAPKTFRLADVAPPQ